MHGQKNIVIPNLVCYLYILNHNLYHFDVAPVYTCRCELFFFQIRTMSFAECVACVGKSRMAQYFWLNLKDINHIICLDTEEKILLNSIIR